MFVTVKAVICDANGQESQVRKFVIDKQICTSFGYLVNKLEQLIPELADHKFDITWRDEENDMITMLNDEELTVALLEGKKDYLNIFVTKKRMNTAKNNMNKEGDVHYGVKCDSCLAAIKGSRYKCLVCPDFDLCLSCEMAGKHNMHKMVRLFKPLEKTMDEERKVPTKLTVKNINGSPVYLLNMPRRKFLSPEKDLKNRILASRPRDSSVYHLPSLRNDWYPKVAKSHRHAMKKVRPSTTNYHKNLPLEELLKGCCANLWDENEKENESTKQSTKTVNTPINKPVSTTKPEEKQELSSDVKNILAQIFPGIEFNVVNPAKKLAEVPKSPKPTEVTESKTEKTVPDEIKHQLALLAQMFPGANFSVVQTDQASNTKTSKKAEEKIAPPPMVEDKPELADDVKTLLTQMFPGAKFSFGKKNETSQVEQPPKPVEPQSSKKVTEKEKPQLAEDVKVMLSQMFPSANFTFVDKESDENDEKTADKVTEKDIEPSKLEEDKPILANDVKVMLSQMFPGVEFNFVNTDTAPKANPTHVASAEEGKEIQPAESKTTQTTLDPEKPELAEDLKTMLTQMFPGIKFSVIESNTDQGTFENNAAKTTPENSVETGESNENINTEITAANETVKTKDNLAELKDRRSPVPLTTLAALTALAHPEYVSITTTAPTTRSLPATPITKSKINEELDNTIPIDVYPFMTEDVYNEEKALGNEADKNTEALAALEAMGLSNDEGWLTKLVEAKNGDVQQILQALTPSKYAERCH